MTHARCSQQTWCQVKDHPRAGKLRARLAGEGQVHRAVAPGARSRAVRIPQTPKAVLVVGRDRGEQLAGLSERAGPLVAVLQADSRRAPGRVPRPVVRTNGVRRTVIGAAGGRRALTGAADVRRAVAPHTAGAVLRTDALVADIQSVASQAQRVAPTSTRTSRSTRRSNSCRSALPADCRRTPGRCRSRKTCSFRCSSGNSNRRDRRRSPGRSRSRSRRGPGCRSARLELQSPPGGSQHRRRTACTYRRRRHKAGQPRCPNRRRSHSRSRTARRPRTRRRRRTLTRCTKPACSAAAAARRGRCGPGPS